MQISALYKPDTARLKAGPQKEFPAEYSGSDHLCPDNNTTGTGHISISPLFLWCLILHAAFTYVSSLGILSFSPVLIL